MKVCSRCGLRKPLGEFWRRAGAPDGRRNQCAKCLRPSGAAGVHRHYHADLPRAHRRNRQRNLLYRYGITEAQWEAMFEAQGRKCAICGAEEPGTGEGWTLDHDHSCCPRAGSCGQCIRGILCGPCNRGLGAFADSLERLDGARAYLIAHGMSDGSRVRFAA